ncbi:MAG TPA: aldehyde dehydrogenase family protein [Myxococcaceae bacterium]|nr:aldehyde dehydrogenase family protein [Myxococcaceae bacterium]
MKQPTDLNDFATTRREIERVFAAQQANRWKIAQTTAKQRTQKLERLRDAIQARRAELAQAIHADFRKPAHEVELTELMPTLSELTHTIKHLAKWMRPQKVRTPLTLTGTSSHVRYEPRGVVLILAPWNYPFQLLISPLISAIAAGNCSILKPSEKTPNTSAFMKKLVAEVFDESEVATFEGEANVAEALLQLPFDHIFFTGSTKVGQIVMAAAAKHLATVTLELGGKSPAIVDTKADLAQTAERLVWGKFINAGQTCVAPDYVFVHESQRDELVKHLNASISAFYGQTDEQRQQSPDFARMVDDRAFLRIKTLVEQSVASGAKVEVGGKFDPKERYVAPTVLTNVSPQSAVMSEEIFGPVLPVMTYSKREDVYRFIDKNGKPLALYVFSQDKGAVEEVLRNTTSGGVAVNNVIVHLANPNLPFGGVGGSGQGNYHGPYGFKAFSHERAVLTQGSQNLLKMVYPPYSGKQKEMAAKMLRKLNG